MSEFLATRLATHSWVVSFGYSFGDSLTNSEFIQRLSRLTGDSSRDLPNHQTSKIIFLKDFLWDTYFKLLSSSLKPLLQYFYIKTQPIWMVFHSINMSKVILNSFHWFWSLDYHRGWENLIFIKFLYGIGLFWWFALDVGLLWQKEHVLRVDFMLFMHCFTLLFIVCTR